MNIVFIFGAIVHVCAQADGDLDAPGVKAYEDALQMLLNQRMDEHELMSTALLQGLGSNGFDHSYKCKSKTSAPGGVAAPKILPRDFL